MLDGTVGIIEGARLLNDLRAALGIHHLDEDFMRLVAIDSETDTLPVGEVRKLWSEKALIQKDREVEDAERLYRDGALEACGKIIARFGDPSESAVRPTQTRVPRGCSLSPSGRGCMSICDQVAADLEALRAGCLTVSDVRQRRPDTGVPAEIERVLSNLEHYLDDTDIRERDSEYRRFQDAELDQLIHHLRSGDLAKAALVDFVRRSHT